MNLARGKRVCECRPWIPAPMSVAPSFAKASAFAEATVDGTAGRPEGRWIGSWKRTSGIP